MKLKIADEYVSTPISLYGNAKVSAVGMPPM